MLENIRLAKSNNVKVVISTTEQYLNTIRDYFSQELEYIHIETYPSDKYVGLETILRFLTVEKIDADYYFIKDSDSIVTARELYIMNHWMLISKFNYIIMDFETFINKYSCVNSKFVKDFYNIIKEDYIERYN